MTSVGHNIRNRIGWFRHLDLGSLGGKTSQHTSLLLHVCKYMPWVLPKHWFKVIVYKGYIFNKIPFIKLNLNLSFAQLVRRILATSSHIKQKNTCRPTRKKHSKKQPGGFQSLKKTSTVQGANISLQISPNHNLQQILSTHVRLRHHHTRQYNLTIRRLRPGLPIRPTNIIWEYTIGESFHMERTIRRNSKIDVQ